MSSGFSLDDFQTLLRQADPLVTGAAVSELSDALTTLKQRWPAVLSQIERVLDVMTPEERLAPAQMDLARRLHIATCCNLQLEDLDRLVAEFSRVQTLAIQMRGMRQLQQIELVYTLAKRFESG